MNIINYQLHILFAVSLFLTGCAAGVHNIYDQTDGSIVIEYNAYGASLTLTQQAKNIAQQHCESSHRDARYIGGKMVSVWETGERHRFDCVERSIKVDELVEAVKEAQKSNKTVGALENYLGCIRDNVPVLDDVNSDAHTVAYGSHSLCIGLHNSYVDTLLSGLNYSIKYRNIVRKSITENASNKVIPYVLQWRKMSQYPSQSPDLSDDLYDSSPQITL